MSRKRKDAGFEDVGRTVQEELYDALYKTGNSSQLHKAMDIFDKPFNLEQVLGGLESRLSNLLEEFAKGTNFGLTEEFIHFDNVIIMGGIAKSSAISRYQSLEEEEAKRVLKECKYHPSYDCRMLNNTLDFYCTYPDRHFPLFDK